jgi:hypothetical protein
LNKWRDCCYGETIAEITPKKKPTVLPQWVRLIPN